MKMIVITALLISSMSFAERAKTPREIVADEQRRVEEIRENDTLIKMTECRALLEKVDEIKDLDGVKAVLKCIR